MTFPVPGGATFLRARSNLADVANPAAALADLGGMGLIQSTGVGGFALQNGTPNVFTWAIPNDGLLHRFMIFGMISVTVAETGGAINTSFTLPDGTAANFQNNPGNVGTGARFPTAPVVIAKAGTTVTLSQSSALTAGSAILWAELWGL